MLTTPASLVQAPGTRSPIEQSQPGGTFKKLKLSAETVRHLSETEIREAAGGVTGTYTTSCPCRVSFYPAEC